MPLHVRDAPSLLFHVAQYPIRVPNQLGHVPLKARPITDIDYLQGLRSVETEVTLGKGETMPRVPKVADARPVVKRGLSHPQKIHKSCSSTLNGTISTRTGNVTSSTSSSMLASCGGTPLSFYISTPQRSPARARLITQWRKVLLTADCTPQNRTLCTSSSPTFLCPRFTSFVQVLMKGGLHGVPLYSAPDIRASVFPPSVFSSRRVQRARILGATSPHS